jgi:hypothetical protein
VETPELVEAVMVGGKSVAFDSQSGFLALDVQLGPGDEREVKKVFL